MRPFLGPLDGEGRIPADQQTRVAAFLMSAHGAQARKLAVALPAWLRDGWQVTLHAQYCRELEILSLLTRVTSWVFDPMLLFLAGQWEAAWLPRPAEGVADPAQALLIDVAAFGHALHAGIRPAVLLPENISATDGFALALRAIELENGLLMQAQINFLKSPQLATMREAVAAAVDRRHAQVRELWTTMLHGINVETRDRHLAATAYQALVKT